MSARKAQRPDQQPGFWNEFSPPASELARAIQYPWDDPKWPLRVVVAYVADARILKSEPTND